MLASPGHAPRGLPGPEPAAPDRGGRGPPRLRRLPGAQPAGRPAGRRAGGGGRSRRAASAPPRPASASCWPSSAPPSSSSASSSPPAATCSRPTGSRSWRRCRTTARRCPIAEVRRAIERGLGQPIEAVFAELDPVPAGQRLDRPGPPRPDPRRRAGGGQGAAPRHPLAHRVGPGPALLPGPAARGGRRGDRRLHPHRRHRGVRPDHPRGARLRERGPQRPRHARRQRGARRRWSSRASTTPSPPARCSPSTTWRGPGSTTSPPRPASTPSGIARTIIETAFRQLFEDGLFHGDPHPGNVLVQPGNRLALLDFGLVGRLSRVQQEMLVTLIVAVALRDADTDGPGARQDRASPTPGRRWARCAGTSRPSSTATSACGSTRSGPPRCSATCSISRCATRSASPRSTRCWPRRP